MEITELLSKKDITTDDIYDIDDYLSRHVEEALTLLTDSQICEWVNKITEEMYYSYFKTALQGYIRTELIFMDVDPLEFNLEVCLRYYNLTKLLGLNCIKVYFLLANYYLDVDKQKAISFYEEIFYEGFNIYESNYYDYLVEYFRLLKINPAERLIKMINASPVSTYDISIDAVNVYLLTIINLEKTDPRYIEYIDKAIPIAQKLVEEYRKEHTNISWSDSDEERNLCELICLKFEYSIIVGKYLNAIELYRQLTDEIGRSDCTRYYHARDKYYYEMLAKMQADYPELKFFENVRHKSYEVLDGASLDQLKGKEITLKKEDGSTFKFLVTSAEEDGHVVIAPILPLLGLGGKLFGFYSLSNSQYFIKIN